MHVNADAARCRPSLGVNILVTEGRMWAALAWAFLYYVGGRNGWSWGAIACVGVGAGALLFALRSAAKNCIWTISLAPSF